VDHLLLSPEEEGVLGPNNPGLCRPGTISVGSIDGGVNAFQSAIEDTSAFVPTLELRRIKILTLPGGPRPCQLLSSHISPIEPSTTQLLSHIFICRMPETRYHMLWWHRRWWCRCRGGRAGVSLLCLFPTHGPPSRFGGRDFARWRCTRRYSIR